MGRGLKCLPGAQELLRCQDSPPGQMHLPGERQSIYRGREGLQGSTPRSGIRLGGGDEYLRNVTSEPLEKGGRLPGLSTAGGGPAPSLWALSFGFIFCHPGMRARVTGNKTRFNFPSPRDPKALLISLPRKMEKRKASLQISPVVFFSPLALSKN